MAYSEDAIRRLDIAINLTRGVASSSAERAFGRGEYAKATAIVLRDAGVSVKREKFNGTGDPVYYAYKDGDTFAGPERGKEDAENLAIARFVKL